MASRSVFLLQNLDDVLTCRCRETKDWSPIRKLIAPTYSYSNVASWERELTDNVQHMLNRIDATSMFYACFVSVHADALHKAVKVQPQLIFST